MKYPYVIQFDGVPVFALNAHNINGVKPYAMRLFNESTKYIGEVEILNLVTMVAAIRQPNNPRNKRWATIHRGFQFGVI